jgi:quercetin dioxygenase-like cupin family protein
MPGTDFASVCCFSLIGLTLSLGSASPVEAQDVAPPTQALPTGVVEITPADVRWKARGHEAGLEQAELVGAQNKAGLYVVRHKFPAGFKAPPHTHPDMKMYTVISGTFCVGYGDTFDEGKLNCLPAGSFYMEPPNTPHFVEMRTPVIIQVIGTGPSGTTVIGKQAKH